MKKILIPSIVVLLAISSCVSKKKYVQLEDRYTAVSSNLQKETLAKENLEAKFAVIEKRVDLYNSKINSLKSINESLDEENSVKLDLVGTTAVISKKVRAQMLATLSKVNPADLAAAKTLKDSLNLVMSYNLKSNFNGLNIGNSEDLNINIDKTVVMITVSDKLLFPSGSHKVNRKAYPLIKKIANVINSEPSMDVMIEGHTDSRTINTNGIEDNWDLSVKRATSIVRVLANKYNVSAARLIASGRGSAMPLVANDSKENRARNRRTRIVILPNLNKFLALLAADETALKN